MEDSFSPRTVAIVALSSLVGGFVAVFGGWMLLHRAPPASPPLSAPATAPTPTPAVARVDASTAAEPGAEPAPTPGAEPDADAGAEPAAPLVTDGGTISIGSITVSRCWAAGSPAVTPGAACDRLPALDQHLAARAAQIAGCASGHGRLALVLDFRVSTNFARAWGGPSSTIPNAGVVAACVRRVSAPLPLTTMPHQFDRYIANVTFEW